MESVSAAGVGGGRWMSVRLRPSLVSRSENEGSSKVYIFPAKPQNSGTSDPSLLVRKRRSELGRNEYISVDGKQQKALLANWTPFWWGVAPM